MIPGDWNYPTAVLAAGASTESSTAVAGVVSGGLFISAAASRLARSCPMTRQATVPAASGPEGDLLLEANSGMIVVS